MTDRPNARMCIFFKDCSEDAVRFYAETIPNTHVDHVQPIGSSMNMVLFRVMDTHFMALDGNENFAPSKDHSISIATLNQAETDRLWEALSEGGSEGPCGWLCDRFGVHWQVVPTAMTHMLSDPDREAAGRVQSAMMKMKKIDIASLEAAFRGET
ncbi:VOC family protein [Sulfitobacter sp. S0837]|uniref:VOC family protein n=1 Tax=Sulfitobacter maritimus TaxID=2741719 RepID=UPI001583637C|nr:VOC family protein [Sulfitobacter maritimus]NUH65222.1 VOC family protein [Sulfitobacter maritimus]